VAKRIACQDLYRVAAYLSATAKSRPATSLEFAESLGVQPPLAGWEAHKEAISECVDDKAWGMVTKAVDMWPLCYGMVIRFEARGDAEWTDEMKTRMTTLEGEFMAARAVISESKFSSK
jgi:hypothetical protein